MPVAPSARRVCVDTGGTFTDLIELDRGRLSVHKVVSTPSAPADAVLAALTHVGGGERGGRLVHGHTVGLNALLTGRGARVALVTNRGFEDLIEIGAQVFSIGEPFMMGVEQLAGNFGQRVCFECSPDNRSILSRADKDEIEAAVDQLVAGFSSEAGGLILIAAPDNFDCVPVEAQQMAMAAVRRASSP